MHAVTALPRRTGRASIVADGRQASRPCDPALKAKELVTENTQARNTSTIYARRTTVRFKQPIEHGGAVLTGSAVICTYTVALSAQPRLCRLPHLCGWPRVARAL